MLDAARSLQAKYNIIMERRKILVVCDNSYFEYYVLFGAVNQFMKRKPDEAKLLIKDPKETDQENLPDLLTSSTFRKILKEMTMKRCEVIDWVLKQNFQDELDMADQIDIVFAQDDRVSKSFRKTLYPEYKLQRAFAPKSFKTQPIKDYISNVIFKDLDVEAKYGYRFVKVDGAEGDDVIATVMQSLEGYMLKVLFASDKDFLQIDGIKQFDLSGKEVKRIVANEELSAHDFLMMKLLLGDASDNIPKVFDKVGPKKALKLIRDKDALKAKLKESQASAKQFKLNKQLICFSEMPKELKDKILEAVNEKVFSLKPAEQDVDLAEFMTL